MKPEPNLTSLRPGSAPNSMNRLRVSLWFSLVANILLLVCLTWLMIKPPHSSYLASSAAGLDMKAGYENGPISLLLDKEFDKNASFMLFDKDQELMLSKHNSPSAEEPGLKYASISLGVELELACYYVCGPKPSFREFWLTMSDRVLEDLNADGQYDLRIWMPSAKKSNDLTAMDVWFNNEWQEVIRGVGEKYGSEYTLKNGLKVSFDRTSGRWVPLTRDAK